MPMEPSAKTTVSFKAILVLNIASLFVCKLVYTQSQFPNISYMQVPLLWWSLKVLLKGSLCYTTQCPLDCISPSTREASSMW